MPRVPSSPSTPPDMKPYLIPSSSRDSAKSKPNISPESSSKKMTGKTGRPWAEGEKIILFKIVNKEGASAKNFEGVIEGRTGRQCYLTWAEVVRVLGEEVYMSMKA